MITQTARKWIVIALLVIAAVWSAAYFGPSAWRAHAGSKAVALTSVDDFQAYETIDRDQQTLQNELAKLNLMNNIDQQKKVEMRKRLGVPENFVEKREDDKNPNSPVIGFVEPAEKK